MAIFIGLLITLALFWPFIDMWYYSYWRKPKHTLAENQRMLSQVMKKIADEKDYYELNYLYDRKTLLESERESILRWNRRHGE